jgi:alginate O-acetyltransferase complex protein AlgI
MLLRALLYSLAILIGLIVSARSNSPRVRLIVLLVLSYILYASWGAWFTVVLVGSTLMNWLLGRRLRVSRKPAILWTAVGLNILLLSAFKYLPEIAIASPWLRQFSHIVLPLGISFWTFQAMSYLFDVYGGAELDPDLLEFAVFMAFFPVTISGPICRLPEMLRQFRAPKEISRANVGCGVSRIATGILMMLLAQLLGEGLLTNQGINFGFDQATRWTGADVWCLACGFGLYLFLAFAGYSHVAIGAAKVMGFTVPENFDRPFLSTSPSIFWTRQHMSLSFWIKDYVYFPMAMLRGEEWWSKLCLLLSMVIFGLWHKGTVLFLLFGAYHGLLLVGHRQILAIKKRLRWKPSNMLWTFASWLTTMALICLGWIFFRADSLSQAGQMFRAVLAPGSYLDHFLPSSLYLSVGLLALGYALTLLAVQALDHFSDDSKQPKGNLLGIAARDRWVWLAPAYGFAMLAIALIISHLASAPMGPFVYRNY